MKALILNSGMGTRMGMLADEHPKCMTELKVGETIVSRQLAQLADYGVKEVVMTTGRHAELLQKYCMSLSLPLQISFVQNPEYSETNYIYSIYCAREQLHDDLILMHGDLVMENMVMEKILLSEHSCVAVASGEALPEKDFKAVVKEGRVSAVGVEFFDNAVAAQPLYRLQKKDWEIWLEKIIAYCERGERGCYAEKALNEVSGKMALYPLETGGMLCHEIDDAQDLEKVSAMAEQVASRGVYMCFSSDVIHGGHIAIIKRAARLGRLTIGVMSDEAVASYKRFPLVPFEERKTMFASIAGVDRVVEQNQLSYRENLERYRPAIVVHGDDWREGFQQPIRREVVEILAGYGGKLVEYPYSSDSRYKELDSRMKAELSLPDARRGRLKRLLQMKGLVTAMEAHNGLTGLIVEKTMIHQDGATRQFDAMWISSLCDSTAKGKPDIELVDMTSRFRTVEDICEVTTKPIIFDGDTGGLTEHFVYTVRTLERMGVSMVIIEDKTGLKKNSLFGTEAEQTQDSIAHFSEKIRAGKKAQKSKDFMICARIESLILERGMEDALARAFAFVEAGADAIMMHSRKKEPDEIFTFLERFREKNAYTPVVLVPTSYNQVTEEEFREKGANIVIYANQLTRTGFPAMQRAAETILTHHRAKECDENCMSIRDIITLIPEE
ncbi:MAG: phosphoenolpyruvate mutase [Lachnospiraceae bacterium]|nr:phosphoenolpyruvate mutase [Lachnospiraceae bacterium]